ncbi:hypothetical protein [Chamaesiphon sp. OTE_8_metabat_110]|uniref:hypothetical protein n=1 Tax=Chamaesiphon sp. OTE_8_metabat_110 TaxID=2964696 RepID=UPI00286CFE93|nr:hypothetical protein [Chamaesiphon sp. OTE_8_metabat_110]
MSALPSFEPPQQRSRRISSKVVRSPLKTATVEIPKSAPTAPRKQLKPNPAYAHRRQGLEAATKLVTYSTLSVFGAIALFGSIGYNYSQRNKLQHLETALQAAKIRTEQVDSNFIRAFDPQAQVSVMQENSYKVAPDRLQIYLVAPTAKPAVPVAQSKPARSAD